MADKKTTPSSSNKKKYTNVKQTLSLQDVLDGVLDSESDEDNLYSSIDGDSSIDGSDCDDDLSDRNQSPKKDPCFGDSVLNNDVSYGYFLAIWPDLSLLDMYV